MTDALGTLIRHHRRERRLTLEEAAKKIGLSTSYLSDLERGRTEPSLSTLRALVDFFGFEVTHIRVVELEAEVIRLRKIVEDVRTAVRDE